ncbi:MAG: hypothetical protein WD030_00600, partial [Pirellulales bacterium]
MIMVLRTPSVTDNVFQSLNRWATQQDENFVTDSFAYLLRLLVRNDRAAAATILQKLTGGCFDISLQTLAQVQIETQVATDHGYPDIRITCAGHCALVEVKVESPPDQSQLARYRKALDECGVQKTCLVLLTRYPAELDPTLALPDHKVRWLQIADWLQSENGQQIDSPISRFMTEQFVTFLQQRGMAVRQLQPDLAPGI